MGLTTPCRTKKPGNFRRRVSLVVRMIENYFRLVEILVNVVDKLVPTAVTPVIITTAIKAAIKPYSMAVAPFLSCRNVLSNEVIARSQSCYEPTVTVTLKTYAQR